MRRINWRITARRSQLYVTEAHPERNTDVVLFLDSFSDLRLTGTSSLDLAVRGAASIAEHYLARRDRVGLIGFGGTLLSGDLFGVILFSKVTIPKRTADLFRYLSADVRAGIVPPQRRGLFAPPPS